MIFSARQLEDLHKANGHVALPRNARLTPLAQDWLKARKLAIVYTDLTPTPHAGAERSSAPASSPLHPSSFILHPSLPYLWWCDGPCGIAKAALSAHRDAPLTPLPTAADAGKTLAVAKDLASTLKSGTAAGAIVFVQSSAAAMLYLNRCPSIRAVLGTNLQTVDLAIRQLAANVLVIEYPTQTLQQMKNLIGRFVKAKRDLSPETRLALQELASCG